MFFTETPQLPAQRLVGRLHGTLETVWTLESSMILNPRLAVCTCATCVKYLTSVCFSFLLWKLLPTPSDGYTVTHEVLPVPVNLGSSSLEILVPKGQRLPPGGTVIGLLNVDIDRAIWPFVAAGVTTRPTDRNE